MENKNVLLAIVISAAIIIAWTYFVQGPQMAAQQAQMQAQQAAQQAQQPAQPQQQAAPQEGGRKVVSREEALKASPRVAIDSPLLKGSINLKGARLDDLVLKNYRETVDPNSPNIVLLSPLDTQHAYYTDNGWSTDSKDIKLPDKDTVWQADGTDLSLDKPVTLTWDNGQGLTFSRKFEIDPDYMFTITDSVTNAGSASVEIAPYGRIVRYGTPEHVSQTYVLHEGPIGVFDGTLEEMKYSAVKSEGAEGAKTTYTSTGGWMGISDKYWLVSQIPSQNEALTSNIFYDPKGDFYQVDFVSAKQQVPAGASATRTQHLFAGAKVVSLLEAYGGKLNLIKFDFAVDFGWFWFLTKPLFKILDWIYYMVGNFGISILCLTVLVKAAMPAASTGSRT